MGLQRQAEPVGELRDLETGVRRIAAAIVEKVADVVRLEDLDQPLVLRRIVLEFPELVARRSERAGGRMAQAANRRGRFLAGIDQILGERADDAVAPCIDLADLAFVLATSLDHAAGGGVDDRGDSSGLCIESVPWLRGRHCRPRERRAKAAKDSAPAKRSALASSPADPIALRPVKSPRFSVG